MNLDSFSQPDHTFWLKIKDVAVLDKTDPDPGFFMIKTIDNFLYKTLSEFFSQSLHLDMIQIRIRNLGPVLARPTKFGFMRIPIQNNTFIAIYDAKLFKIHSLRPNNYRSGALVLAQFCV